jgi:hypothetical protein
MEARHYLAFFRLRRWLENHLVPGLPPAAAGSRDLPALRLSHRNVDAVRRAYLCLLAAAGCPVSPNLRFEFRPVAESLEPMRACGPDLVRAEVA